MLPVTPFVCLKGLRGVAVTSLFCWMAGSRFLPNPNIFKVLEQKWGRGGGICVSETDCGDLWQSWSQGGGDERSLANKRLGWSLNVHGSIVLRSRQLLCKADERGPPADSDPAAGACGVHQCRSRQTCAPQDLPSSRRNAIESYRLFEPWLRDLLQTEKRLEARRRPTGAARALPCECF